MKVPGINEGPTVRKITTPADIVVFVRAAIPQDGLEHCVLLVLDDRNHLIYWALTDGTATSCPFAAQEALDLATKNDSRTVAVGHNHPPSSGCPSPSGQDLLVARRFWETGKLMGIKVLDFVVVSHGTEEYASLAETGFIPPGQYEHNPIFWA